MNIYHFKKTNRKGLTNKWVENQKLKDGSIAYSFKNFENEGKIICYNTCIIIYKNVSATVKQAITLSSNFQMT